ncbi:novel immune-type receptor 9 isoform 2 precursor [Danio rerio]|uniref:Novel immune-type receptor 9 isoform 2 precursor n=1 Tax=Danio rerio TaxID=7955 RepID=A0A8M1N2F3_DANRE|nr:novel immune-type receptor 9 isoform 2 precursor [Danio rerio]
MINFWIFGLFCLIGISSTHPNAPPVFVKLGESVNMSCIYQSQMARHFSWYKHKPGQNPMLISTIYKNVQFSDSATYYCGGAYSNVMEVVKGTRLIVQGLEKHTVVKQHDLIPSHSGDSVSLTCTVLNQKCVGNHSMYWLIIESQDSPPRIISTHGTPVDQCEWISDADFRALRCVYSFSRKDFRLSNSATYSCTVTACGEKLDRNGSKLDIDADSTEEMMILVLLSIARTCLLLLVIVMVIIWYCVYSKRISKNVHYPSDVAFRNRQSPRKRRPGLMINSVSNQQ